MVYSKKEYQDSIKNRFDHFEAIIDRSLKSRGYATVQTSTIGYDLIDGFIKWVKNKYEPAGWAVKRESFSDCRESWDYVQIS